MVHRRFEAWRSGGSPTVARRVEEFRQPEFVMDGVKQEENWTLFLVSRYKRSLLKVVVMSKGLLCGQSKGVHLL